MVDSKKAGEMRMERLRYNQLKGELELEVYFPVSAWVSRWTVICFAELANRREEIGFR